MSRAQHCARSLRNLSLLTAVWLAATSAAWAQEPAAQAGAAGKSYVLPYLMVVLVTALGLLVILRPSARKSGDSRPAKE